MAFGRAVHLLLTKATPQQVSLHFPASSWTSCCAVGWATLACLVGWLACSRRGVVHQNSHHSPHSLCIAVRVHPFRRSQNRMTCSWRPLCEPPKVLARHNVLLTQNLLFLDEISMLWGCCAGSYDGTVFVWELARNTVVSTLNGAGNAPVLGCSWSPQASTSACCHTPTSHAPTFHFSGLADISRGCTLYTQMNPLFSLLAWLGRDGFQGVNECWQLHSWASR